MPSVKARGSSSTPALRMRPPRDFLGHSVGIAVVNVDLPKILLKRKRFLCWNTESGNEKLAEVAQRLSAVRL